MKKILSIIILLCIAQTVHAASFTSSQTGDWSSSSTWGGAGVPGAGDTVTISDNTTVTVSDTRTIGSNSTASTVSISATTTSSFTASFPTGLSSATIWWNCGATLNTNQ